MQYYSILAADVKHVACTTCDQYCMSKSVTYQEQ